MSGHALFRLTVNHEADPPIYTAHCLCGPFRAVSSDREEALRMFDEHAAIGECTCIETTTGLLRPRGRYCPQHPDHPEGRVVPAPQGDNPA